MEAKARYVRATPIHLSPLVPRVQLSTLHCFALPTTTISTPHRHESGSFCLCCQHLLQSWRTKLPPLSWTSKSCSALLSPLAPLSSPLPGLFHRLSSVTTAWFKVLTRVSHSGTGFSKLGTISPFLVSRLLNWTRLTCARSPARFCRK